MRMWSNGSWVEIDSVPLSAVRVSVGLTRSLQTCAKTATRQVGNHALNKNREEVSRKE
jgi:hypothetical protein